MTRLSFDWKGRPSLHDLKEALNPLGIHVYEVPNHGDYFEYVFSKELMTAEAIASLSQEDDDEYL